MTPLPPPPKRFRHHVLFSYSSTDGEYVHHVRDALPKEVNVFDYEQGALWGKSLEKGLDHLYKNEAPFCVVFISPAYLDFKSRWTRKEFAIVARVAKRKPGYMLPVMLDGAAVPEAIGDIVWLDKTLSPEELAARIVARIREPPPQPWWFYLSMQVKVGAAAALLVMILFAKPVVDHFRPSRTSIESLAANAQAITAHLRNSGPKSATLVGQRLKFGALPIIDAELRLDKSASATIAPGERDVALTVLTLDPKCDADGNRPNNVAIETLLGQENVLFEIDVQESNDPPGHPSKRRAAIPAARLKLFLRKWVPNRVPPC